MSVNVYLKDAVRYHEGFKVIVKPGSSSSDVGRTEYKLSGIKLYYGKGRWCIQLSDTDQVPIAVADIVDEIWLLQYIRVQREEGVYRLKSAEAEVIQQSENGRPIWQVKISAPKIVDVHELFRRIRVGSIRPVDSFEGPQGGKSRAELEAELERLRQNANGAMRMWEETNADLVSLKGDLRAYYLELLRGSGGFWWLFCRKNRVMRRIIAILNPTKK